MTILMGSFARFPIAIAAGLGLNAYVTFGLAQYELIPWNVGLGREDLDRALPTS